MFQATISFHLDAELYKLLSITAVDLLSTEFYFTLAIAARVHTDRMANVLFNSTNFNFRSNQVAAI